MYRLLTLMFFHKMTPPQAHDSRPKGTEATQERPHCPRFVEDVFVNPVEIMAKNIFSQISVIKNQKPVQICEMYFSFKTLKLNCNGCIESTTNSVLTRQ